MNRDDIIRLAREAGLVRTGDGWTEPHRWGMAEIERFAALVAAALAEPEQEPVAWMEMVVANLVREGVNKHKARQLAQHFTAPPQRKPLTDKELFKIWLKTPSEEEDRYAFARAVEAAHSIKGEA